MVTSNGTNGQAERTRDAGPADPHDQCHPEADAAGSDWRTTECVIEGPDVDGDYRVFHKPSCQYWYGEWKTILQCNIPSCRCGFGYYYHAAEDAKKALATIPLDSRPIPAERPEVYVGNEISNRPATPDEAARAAADANAVATQVEVLCDQFGIPKPPEGKGVPAAPSPDFLTWDDRPVYRGAVLAPVTAPDSQWIAGEIVAGDLLELIGVDGKREIMLSREAFRSCWGYADRRAEPAQDPEDIAQAIFLELDLAVKTEPTRRRLRSLVLKLLRTR